MNTIEEYKQKYKQQYVNSKGILSFTTAKEAANGLTRIQLYTDFIKDYGIDLLMEDQSELAERICDNEKAKQQYLWLQSDYMNLCMDIVIYNQLINEYVNS